MKRRNVCMALSLAALLATGCAGQNDAAQGAEQTSTTAEQASTTVEQDSTPVQVADTKQAASEAIATARGVVVRRADSFQNGTNHVHLLIRMNGPNDEKVYFTFSLTSAFAGAPLTQVGDRVELTYINRGWIDVQGFDLKEPKLPDESK